MFRPRKGRDYALPDSVGDPPPDTSSKVEAPPSDTSGKVAQAYSYPWPDEVEGLGRRVDSFDCCAVCGIGSWVRYGTTVLCLAHAKEATP